MVDGLFALFAVVFGVSRLYLYPFWAIWSVVDIWFYIGWAVTPMIGTFLALLLTLQALHIFWFSTIVQMVRPARDCIGTSVFSIQLCPPTYEIMHFP